MAETTEPRTDAPTPRPPKNGELMAAVEALEAMSKIGTKRDESLKRLARTIRWCRRGLETFFAQRDVLTDTWAEKDEAGDIVTVATSDGKGKTIAFSNEAEYQMRLNALLREPAKLEGDEPMPKPYEWKDLQPPALVRTPDARTIAQLGPFVILDDD